MLFAVRSSQLAIPCLIFILLTFYPLLSVAQDEFLQPGNNLKVAGVPPIPIKLVKSLEEYTKSYGPLVTGWHPKQRELWLKWPVGHIRLMRTEEPRGIPKFWREIGGTGTYDVYFQPQGNYLIYNQDLNGNEMFQMHLYNLQTGETRSLINTQSRCTEFAWSNDGHQVAFSYTSPDSESVSLAWIDPFQPNSMRLVSTVFGHYLKAYDWSPDNEWIAYIDFSYSNKSSLWIYNIRTGGKNPLSSPLNRGYYDLPKFSKDGRGVYLITDQGSDNHQLVYLDLKTKKFNNLTSSIHSDIDNFELSPDGKIIALTSNENGFSQLHLLNTITKDIKVIREIPDGVISNIKWHNNSTDLAFNLSSYDTPNDSYYLNTTTMALDIWFKSRSHGPVGQKYAKPEMIQWKSVGGLNVSGFLYRPPEKFSGPRPVIIDIHGGPASQYRPEFRGQDNFVTNYLGMVQIYPNVRGSSGYGRRFLDLDNGLNRENAVKDIGALLEWISKQDWLNSSSIIVRGGSYGGYLALSAGMKYGHNIRGIISEAGISNLASMLQNTAKWRLYLRRNEYGDERVPAIRTFLERSAPSNNTDKIKAPLLIIHSRNDVRVSIKEAETIVNRVSQNGPQVWSLIALEEGHETSSYNDWRYELGSLAMFLIEQLKQSGH